MRRLLCSTLAALALPAVGVAQDVHPLTGPAAPLSLELPADDASADSAVRNRRPLAAALTGLGANLLINRVDAWVIGQDWARVGPDSWRRNLRLGWEWDEDAFTVNMFSHPYHGSLYFNAGRNNGLDFWGSAPLAFLGSWTWERFGETYRPSLNDFFMTSLGGIALGEVTHRLSQLLRGNRGESSGWRQALAAPLDPIGTAYRLIGKDLVREMPRPAGGVLQARLAAGTRAASASGRADDVSAVASLVAELEYGDPFAEPYTKPYDVFILHLQLTNQGLAALRASGRLYSMELTPRHVASRHQVTLTHSYVFVDNPAYSFGAQGLDVGLTSRLMLPKGLELRTSAAAEGIVLGAVDAPGSGIGKRIYDFGPGFGLVAGASLRRNGRVLAAATYRSSYIHSVSGADADHFTHFAGLDGILPLPRGLGVGVHTGYYLRTSNYQAGPSETRRFPEARLYLTWGTNR